MGTIGSLLCSRSVGEPGDPGCGAVGWNAEGGRHTKGHRVVAVCGFMYTFVHVWYKPLFESKMNTLGCWQIEDLRSESVIACKCDRKGSTLTHNFQT